MKTKFALLAIFIVSPAGIVAAWWLWSDAMTTPPTRLAVENFARIQNGMTQAEVETFLGGPPGNYGRHKNGGSMMTLEGYIAPQGATEKVWCDDANRFEIYFDAQDRVVGLHRRAGYQQTPPESLLTWLRRQLGL